jgi:hypothetical protein
LAMLVGFLPRLAGLLLAGNMVGAFLTAGRIDGGADLVVPPVLAVIALLAVALGRGRLGWNPAEGRTTDPSGIRQTRR